MGAPRTSYMGRLILPLLFTISFLAIILSSSADSVEGTSKGKNIVIIFSYAPNTPAHSIILDGIRQKLFETYGDNFNLYIEYLEAERYPQGEYPAERFDLLNHKYENLKLDLLVTVGYGSPAIILEYADNHILNLPAIVVDYDFSRYMKTPDIRINDRTTIIPLKWDFEKSLSVALELYPETSQVYYVGGTAKMDSLFLALAREASGKFAGTKKINFVNGMAMDEVLTFVRKLPEKSIVIISSFNADSRQVQYLYSEAARLISLAASAPVFVYADTGFGSGAVGGYLVSFNKVGDLAGDVAVKILEGADPTKITSGEKDVFEFLFDWRVLQKWNIHKSSQLPEGSIVMYHRQTFFERYKWLLLAILVFITLQTILIFKLILLNRKQRIMNSLILDSENKYGNLIREDRLNGIGQLTSSLSHELNQPLTSMLSNAQAGVRFIDSDRADKELIKEIFLNIVEDNKRASAILSSVRNIMKLENRNKEKTDLKILVTEIVDLCRSKITENKCRLDLELPPEPLWVVADGIQIQQVLLNLILNATQAMNKDARGNIIRIIATKDQEYVCISVIDNGKGIDPSVKDKLFKTFVTSKKDGSGIGLTLARSIIEDHKGKIWAENNPAGGAEFSFNLKLCDV